MYTRTEGVPFYSHASAAWQVQMPMNDYQGQTNMVNSAIFYEQPHFNGSSNIDQDVSSFFS